MSGTDCERALASIELYLDGELAVEVAAEVHAHVEGCSPCAERAAFERRLKEIVRGACSGCEPPPELLARIRAFLDAADG